MTRSLRQSLVPLLAIASTLEIPAQEAGVEIENAGTTESVGADADPFAAEGAASTNMRAIGEANATKTTASARVRFEVFEVPVLASLTMLDDEKDPAKIRGMVLALVKKKEAALTTLHALRGEVGTSITAESITEAIYPTEYDPPELIPPNSPLNQAEEKLNATQRQQKVALSFASPSAFDTKNIGVTLEAEVSVVATDEKLWDVALSYTDVSHEKDKSWVEGTVTMPVFKVDAVHNFSRVQDGSWNLWSVSPLVDGKGISRTDAVRMAFLKVERLR